MTFREQIENDIYFKSLPSCDNCENKGSRCCDNCVIGKNQDKMNWQLSDEELRKLSTLIAQDIDNFLWRHD